MTTCFDRARFSSSAHRPASASARSPKCSRTSRSNSASRASATVRSTLRQLEDLGAGQPVEHEQAVLSAVDQRRLPERLQVLRGVGEREADFGRERVHRALALGEQLEHFQPVGAGERLADAGELAVEAVLEVAVRVDRP